MKFYLFIWSTTFFFFFKFSHSFKRHPQYSFRVFSIFQIKLTLQHPSQEQYITGLLDTLHHGLACWNGQFLKYFPAIWGKFNFIWSNFFKCWDKLISRVSSKDGKSSSSRLINDPDNNNGSMRTKWLTNKLPTLPYITFRFFFLEGG